MEAVKRTSLYSLHRALGARMTRFGGFEMPLNYSGIIPEHRAVRHAAGIFDLSHMGEFELRGDGALPMLERALSNAAGRLADGQAQYTIMCAEDGGSLDDLIVYRLAADRYMLCVNAANIASDREWLLGLRCPGVELVDLSEELGLVAIQGPRAESILGSVSKVPLAALRRFHWTKGEVTGVDCLVARTGYTGEDGFEVFVGAKHAPGLFEAIIMAGTGDGLIPCGLGARDTLRMEAGLPLHGHELNHDISPLEAGLASFVKFGHGFIGEAALVAQRAAGPKRHLIGIKTDDGKSIARQGYKLFFKGDESGIVTSGTFAPTFDRPLAIGLVDTAAQIQPGTEVAVKIRDREVTATTIPLPFYRRTPN
jgi:aminomethyltransferase